MFEKIKSDLRIRNSRIDEDVEDVIEVCKADMERVGIVYKVDDPLIIQCTKLYARGFFNYQGDGDEYFELYKRLRNSISLDKDRQNVQ